VSEANNGYEDLAYREDDGWRFFPAGYEDPGVSAIGLCDFILLHAYKQQCDGLLLGREVKGNEGSEIFPLTKAERDAVIETAVVRTPDAF
jgi:hypothetical protein